MRFMGDLPPTVGHPRDYFDIRGIELDCRGELEIDATSNWGWDVRVYTQSHYIKDGQFGGAIHRPVIVKANAWIGSGSILYNCIVGEGAIVAAGTVVRSCEVKPYTMVAGNPARVIARFKDGAWAYVAPRWSVLE
jgi:acetyltransferase-like isoleucine patch superfamily enzyme